jgi:hypothetical protein
MGYNQHKQCHRGKQAHYAHHLSLRVVHTLSWFYRSESCQNNPDGQFVFLWVAFNAAYAEDLACLNASEAATFSEFMTKICNLNQNSHDNSLNRRRNSTRPTLLWQTNTPVKSSNWF